MKAVLTTLGKFHSFDLARQLDARGFLQTIFTGYPRFKLKDEHLQSGKIRTFPYVHTPYMASPGRHRLGVTLLRAWEYWDRVSLDRHVARNLTDVDVFVGLSGCGLHTGKIARQRGALYVCDRGSTHIRNQDEVLMQEHQRLKLPYIGTDPRIIDREQAEYAEADLITVPSAFAQRTFIERGVSSSKVHVLPYGVDLSRFHPVQSPDDKRLDLLFVGSIGVRKGVAYLLEAFKRVNHPHKSLTLAGTVEPGFVERMQQLGLVGTAVKLIGHVPQPELKALMSRSHALVLPSLEEGLALVMGQALACGCPVIATPNTGAENLFTDGVEGRLVSCGNVDELCRVLEQLADEPAMRQTWSDAAIRKVKAIGGWSEYGSKAISLYESFLSKRTVPAQ